MRRAAEDGDLRLWKIVAATVRPLRPARSPGAAPDASPAAKGPISPPAKPKVAAGRTSPAVGKPSARRPAAIDSIEPGRRRGLERGRDRPAGVIDLHGLNQDEARASLTGFLLRAFAEQRRMVLVITGKGALGDGVLRRRAPEWLAEPPLRGLVAGVSEAHRRHGGAGALYVALRRPSPPDSGSTGNRP